MIARLLVLVVVAVLVAACSDTIVMVPTAPGTVPVVTNPNQPTPTPTPQPIQTRIEFRVAGNASSVRVRYSTPADGLAQVVTTLPYNISIATTEATLFLSLEALPMAYAFNITHPFLSVQIVAGGVMFREAVTTDFLLNPVVVSGTWRR